MPDDVPCEDLLGDTKEKLKDARRACQSYTSAIHNMNAAQASRAGGYAGMIGCLLAAPTIGGFAACESAAAAAAYCGEEWVDSAEEALDLAEDILDDEVEELEDLYKKLCACVNEQYSE